jgi:LysR family transcriptional regulator, glycine cleavage system transcriptional activator
LSRKLTYRLPPLQWLRAFEASARHASFTAAARELAVTPAAVSHQIRSLEGVLGYRLFERQPRSLQLTDMGKAYLPPVRKAFEELSISTAGLFGLEGDLPLNVRVPVSFAVLWLAPRIGRFIAAYPKLRIRLFSVIWADSAPGDRADVDIRFGHGKWPGYTSSLLINEPSVAVCHPGLDVHGLEGIGQARLIHIMGLEDEWFRLFRSAGLVMRPEHPFVTVDTSLAALELAAAGEGAAVVLERFAAVYERQGRIRRVPDLSLAQDQGHYFLAQEGSGPMRPEVLLFRDWLFEEIKAPG